MDCKQAVSYIHEYLDRELSRHQETELKKHLTICSHCKKRFQSLQQTVAFVQSASHVRAPMNFTKQVLDALPKASYGYIWKQKMRRHPFLVAGTIFALFALVVLFAQWTGDQQFHLTADQLHRLHIDDETGKVIVPSNSVVTGDIIVRNADIEVKGRVMGDVTAIDGSVILASSGSVSGKREEIDQAMEWLWYHIRSFAVKIAP